MLVTVSEYYEPAELRALSGYKHPSRQIRWLREQHIPYLLDKDGRPKVLRATVAAMLSAPANQSGPALRFASR